MYYRNSSSHSGHPYQTLQSSHSTMSQNVALETMAQVQVE